MGGLGSRTDQSGEARYPSMKGILAAKKKPVESWTLADLGIDSTTVSTCSATMRTSDIGVGLLYRQGRPVCTGRRTHSAAAGAGRRSFPTLIGFGVDSGIEVISAIGLLWRLRKAGPHAEVAEESAAERRAIYVVAATFFLLAAYITYEAVGSLIRVEEPRTSPVGIVLSILSLAIMPALAIAKQRTGRDMGSRALVADSTETWVCSYLSLSLLIGVSLHALVGWWWADPIAALAMLPIIIWQGWETLNDARDSDGA